VSDAILMPVYNEGDTVGCVLDAVRAVFGGAVVVVDDGSTDETVRVLAGRKDVTTLRHDRNLGYGQALIDAFGFARQNGFERVITMDCDGQHEPRHVPEFLAALAEGWDIVSGSRYLPESRAVGPTPPQRREVNARVTAVVNRLTGWSLSDAFCGFKAYRLAALDGLELREAGYGMPMELWAKGWRKGLRVRELPIERIYNDHDRSFGEDLADPEKRFAYYLRVWERALAEEIR
jgi:dolichol-phosphate mannosyltransferase